MDKHPAENNIYIIQFKSKLDHVANSENWGKLPMIRNQEIAIRICPLLSLGLWKIAYTPDSSITEVELGKFMGGKNLSNHLPLSPAQLFANGGDSQIVVRFFFKNSLYDQKLESLPFKYEIKAIKNELD
ncbi:hypothetical protein F8M41_005089 [Gigaspora margarita]|uniref:Uncharacterized protein n=1 Tax=Gigaspora margarita TaxID=4874 RepID=A0A8H3XA70_GIGMA|nr:hypothetical protein F8M41_005089 [Gigaspora margarita]